MKNLILILSITTLTTSCGEMETVQFQSPQPSGGKSLVYFNSSTEGTYIDCKEKSIELTIKDDKILKTYSWKDTIHRNDLLTDSTFLLDIQEQNIDIQNNDDLTSYFNNDLYKGIDVKIVADSIFFMSEWIDTVFQVSNEQVLKKYKKSYFLNYQVDNNWNVKRIETKGDTLFIGEIYPSDTLLRFDFITKHEKISDTDTTVNYLIIPTKKELKELIKSNTFEQTECYCKKNDE